MRHSHLYFSTLFSSFLSLIASIFASRPLGSFFSRVRFLGFCFFGLSRLSSPLLFCYFCGWFVLLGFFFELFVCQSLLLLSSIMGSKLVFCDLVCLWIWSYCLCLVYSCWVQLIVLYLGFLGGKSLINASCGLDLIDFPFSFSVSRRGKGVILVSVCMCLGVSRWWVCWLLLYVWVWSSCLGFWGVCNSIQMMLGTGFLLCNKCLLIWSARNTRGFFCAILVSRAEVGCVVGVDSCFGTGPDSNS